MTAIRRVKEVNAHDDALAPVDNLPIHGPEPGWVETPTFTQIYQAVRHAHETPTLIFVEGPPGVGKTLTGKVYVGDHAPVLGERGAHYVNLLGVKSAAALLHTIFDTVPTRSYIDRYRNATLMRGLCECLGPGALLILDEVQSLRPDALDSVRFFLDEGGIGLALFGNERTYSTITGKTTRAHFAQLSSRIGLRLHLPRPTEADADAVLKAWGVVLDGAGRDYGRDLALGPGGLRQLTQVLRQARIAAVATKRALDHRLMHAAASALGLTE